MSTGAALVIVWLPLLVVWAIVIVDLVRHPEMGLVARLAWGAACTLFWPATIAYLLTRTPRGRMESNEQRTDAHARLVDAVLDHEDARIGAPELAAIVAGLRRR